MECKRQKRDLVTVGQVCELDKPTKGQTGAIECVRPSIVLVEIHLYIEKPGQHIAKLSVANGSRKLRGISSGGCFPEVHLCVSDVPKADRPASHIPSPRPRNARLT